MGPLSDLIPYYDTEGMMPDDRKKFFEWYNPLKQNNYVFDFTQEILTYGRSDVDILRRFSLEFRELFCPIPEIDPFEKCLTIASACNMVFRTHYLEKDTIAVIPPQGYARRESNPSSHERGCRILPKNKIFLFNMPTMVEKCVWAPINWTDTTERAIPPMR